MSRDEKIALISQCESIGEQMRLASELAETDIERRSLLSNNLVFLNPQAE